MDAARVKFNFGRTVIYRGTEYKLTACIMRQGDGGFHLQAELTDLKARSALVIANLKDVEERTDKKMKARMPDYINEVSRTYLEIIGNIHDNPELLEVKT